MIDIHNHLLYGIDDGPKDLETSLAMLKIARNDGIKEIVLTPHIAEEFRYEIDQAKENFEKLKEKANQENIEIK
ncbi:MAG: CpsB/CapC family capsule biosynthesis tyrosine phosphatase, partial [candidate division WOR-3 bacterium]